MTVDEEDKMLDSLYGDKLENSDPLMVEARERYKTQSLEAFFDFLNDLYGPNEGEPDGQQVVAEEMAKPWKDVERDLASENQQLQRINHLFKLYYFRTFPRDLHGWKNSVWKQRQSVPKIKSNKGKDVYPTFAQIYDAVFGCVEDIFENLLDVFISNVNDNNGNQGYKYLPHITVINRDDVLAFVKGYHEWLAEKLTFGFKVSFNDASRQIDNLWDTHPYSYFNGYKHK
jgi:hypothetical protein